MWRRRNAHGENVRSIGLHNAGDVKDAADECALDRAEGLTIEPHGRRIVDAFEGQSEAASAGSFRRVKLYAIPIVLFVQALGDGKIVQAVVGEYSRRRR